MKYNYNGFTSKANEAINYAIHSAEQLGHTYIGSEHLLLGLIREGEGKAFESFLNMQINPNLLKKDIEEEIRQEEVAKWEEMSIEEHMAFYEEQGMDQKTAMKQVAKDRGVGKRDIYNYLHKD